MDPSQSNQLHSRLTLSMSPSPTTEQASEGSRTSPLRTSPELILQELDQEDCDSDFDISDE